MENSRRERERGIGSLCGVESSRNSSDARLLTFRLEREERVGVERGEERLSLSFRGFTLNVCRDFRDFELPFTNSGHSSFFKVVKSREQASSASLRGIYSEGERLKIPNFVDETSRRVAKTEIFYLIN